MKRLGTVIGVFCALSVILAAETQVTVYGLKGPSALGLVHMWETPPLLAGVDVKVQALPSVDIMVAKIINGEAKIGILPPNVAAKLAAAGRPLRIAAVVGNGMLSLLTNDPQVRTIRDLKGSTVEVAGQGATPEYVFRRVLAANGLHAETDLRLGFSLAYPEIAQALIAGRVRTALLPEPFATMARAGSPSLRQVGDVQQEWRKAGGNADYPMTVLVVDASFAAQQPRVLQAIMDAYRASIEWVLANPASAGLLAEKYDLGLKAAVAAASIPVGAYVFVPAPDARVALENLYRAYLEYAPASIGRRMPADELYLDAVR